MKFARFERFAIVTALGAAVVFSGCTRDPNRPSYNLMHHMEDSTAVKAQHEDGVGNIMRTPPEGTIPQGHQPISCVKDDPAAEAVWKDLKNPLPRSKQVLARGQHLFNTYCIVCHGARGEGDGTIVPRFPRPPSLQSDKVRNWRDADIFRVITCGQNLMPTYATQVEATERWAIIHYVRVLQRSLHPQPGDVK